MKQRTLGQTGISVSPLGLGTVKFGRNQGVKYPEAFSLPDDKAIVNLLALCREHHINLLDTAPAYGSSEQRLGKLLQNRHDWIICSKAGEHFIDGGSRFDFTRDGIIHSLQNSLQQLKTDYIDIFLIHSSGDDLEIIERYEVFDTLAQLKQQGLIRAFGMSTKTIAGGLATIEHSDVVMATYNPINTDEKPVLDAAAEKNKGVFIKKAFASGHLHKIPHADPAAYALQYILQHQAVSSIILGTINSEHLLQNIEAVIGIEV